jgi:hypothetical protein
LIQGELESGLEKGPGDEAQEAHGRADHCDLEGTRKHGISEASFYNRKAKYGGLEVSEAKRLKGLESENVRLKKLLADAMLDCPPSALIGQTGWIE